MDMEIGDRGNGECMGNALEMYKEFMGNVLGMHGECIGNVG